MTKFESICIILEEIKKKESSKTGIEKVRDFNKQLEKYWNEKETSILEHCKKNMDCYSSIELCYAEPLMKLANKLGTKLVKVVTKVLSDEDLVAYSNEIDSLTNLWVTKKSRYAGLYHKVEKKDSSIKDDKAPNYTQAQGSLVGDQSQSASTQY